MATIRYTKDHEWIRIDGDIGTVGITDYAQAQLGDIVFVELPAGRRRRSRKGERGGRGRERQGGERRLRAGRPARSSRSTASSTARPALVNEDAEGKGWFFKLKLADPAELDALMDRAAYDGPSLRSSTKLTLMMRYLPLTDADRARHAGARSASPTSTSCSPTCPPTSCCSEPRRPAAPQGRDGGRARAGAGWRRSNVAGRRRCRSSSAPAPTSTTCRRPSTT